MAAAVPLPHATTCPFRAGAPPENLRYKGPSAGWLRRRSAVLRGESIMAFKLKRVVQFLAIGDGGRAVRRGAIRACRRRRRRCGDHVGADQRPNDQPGPGGGDAVRGTPTSALRPTRSFDLRKAVFDQPLDQDPLAETDPEPDQKLESRPTPTALSMRRCELRDDVTFHNGDKMTTERFPLHLPQGASSRGSSSRHRQFLEEGRATSSSSRPPRRR